MTREAGSDVSERWMRWRRSVDLDEYDRRWTDMAARGESVHGELDFVERLFPNRTLSVLDAGCGTGRLAIEAARRGHRPLGVDLDPDMVERAVRKAPNIDWLCADLSRLEIDAMFDVAVMAGNIPLFCAPGSQGDIISSLSRHLVPGGVLICGFTIEKSTGAYQPSDLERDARNAGLVPEGRFSTWDGRPSDADDDYAVIVCRQPEPN